MSVYLAARDTPVAFTARRLSGFRSSIGKITFNAVTTNVGGAYNEKTGIFTCPIDGVYGFIWTLAIDNKKYFFVTLYKNGSAEDFKAYARLTDVKSSVRSQSTMAATFRLTKGDRVWLQADNCSFFWSSPGIFRMEAVTYYLNVVRKRCSFTRRTQ